MSLPVRGTEAEVVEYRHNAHAVTDLKYPVIWVTKYRYKISIRTYIENQRWDEDVDGGSPRRPSLKPAREPGTLQAALAAARLSVGKESTAFRR